MTDTALFTKSIAWNQPKDTSFKELSIADPRWYLTRRLSFIHSSIEERRFLSSVLPSDSYVQADYSCCNTVSQMVINHSTSIYNWSRYW
jgi:hypothetical protein